MSYLRFLLTILVFFKSVCIVQALPKLGAPAVVPVGNPLIQDVRSYVAGDRRGTLSKLANSLGLSAAEVKQIRAVVGEFSCVAEKKFPLMSGTAVVIGDNAQITTAGHGIVNENDKSLSVRDLRNCKFENFEIPPKTFRINTKSERNIILRATNLPNDRARLGLLKPVTGANALLPDFSQSDLAIGEDLILVSAQNRDFKTDGVDPIVASCTVGQVYNPDGGPSRLKTDCESDHGASGGVYLVRHNNTLYAKAIEIGSAASYKEVPNHSPFDSVRNFELGLIIDRDFLGWYFK